MGSKKISALCALVVVLAFGAAFAGGAGAAAKKAPLCSLGQKSTKSKPCRVNPAFAKTGCAAFASQVQELTGQPVIAGPNSGAPTGLSCYFKIGGRIQQFGFGVSRGTVAQAKANYDFSLDEKQGWPAKAATGDMPGCYKDNVQSPVNAPVVLTGVGDRAFTWDQCAPGTPDSVSFVGALKGRVNYWASSTHPNSPASADQSLVFVKRLLAKYSR
jgi:hypothetical protein